MTERTQNLNAGLNSLCIVTNGRRSAQIHTIWISIENFKNRLTGYQLASPETQGLCLQKRCPA